MQLTESQQKRINIAHALSADDRGIQTPKSATIFAKHSASVYFDKNENPDAYKQFVKGTEDGLGMLRKSLNDNKEGDVTEEMFSGFILYMMQIALQTGNYDFFDNTATMIFGLIANENGKVTIEGYMKVLEADNILLELDIIQKNWASMFGDATEVTLQDFIREHRNYFFQPEHHLLYGDEELYDYIIATLRAFMTEADEELYS